MKGRRAHHLVLAASMAWFAVTPAVARAEPVDDSTRSAARRLGEEGVALAERGEHALAFDKLERALSLMRVPTLALLAGKSLEKLGRLVEAGEHYRSAAGMQIDPDLPQAFREAQVEAQAEASAAERSLRSRLSGIVVSVSGARPDEVVVVLDGKTLRRALLGVEIPVDPGEHHIEVRAGGRLLAKRAQLTEGEKTTLTFEVPSAPAPPPVRGSKPPSPDRTPAPSPQVSTPWPTLGFVALGVGAVGLGLGGVYYLRARSKADDLGRDCNGEACPTSAQARVDAYDRDKMISTLGFVAGGVAATAGAVILFAAPRTSSSGVTGMSLGPGGVRLHGAF